MGLDYGSIYMPKYALFNSAIDSMNMKCLFLLFPMG